MRTVPAPTVTTVLGPVGTDQLGRTDYHEHLFQVSPLLPGDELADEPASQVEAASLRGSGFATMVDATPIGLGRRPEAVARISAATGLQVLVSTGAHREPHYGPGHWLLELTEAELAERFCAEVTVGLPAVDAPAGADASADTGAAAGTSASGADTAARGAGSGAGGAGFGALARGPAGPVRAALVKAGIGYWSITAFEHRVLAAVAACWARTGAAVMVHLEDGSAGFEVLAELGRLGVPASAVALAHIDRNPDPGLHADLAAAGAYLGYDGWARTKRWPDSVLLDCLRASIERGAGDRLLIGGDVARRTRYRGYGGMPGLAYLGERVLPRLAAEISTELVDAVLVHNPARWLGGSDDAD